MSSKSETEFRVRMFAGVVVLGTFVSGCSDIYFDRRETVSLGAGDALASDKVIQMVDPWPRWSGNRNIAFNGERIQGAVERYRHHEVIQPRSPLTTTVTQTPAATTTEAIATPQSGANAPASPVKQ